MLYIFSWQVGNEKVRNGNETECNEMWQDIAQKQKKKTESELKCVKIWSSLTETFVHKKDNFKKINIKQ